MAFRLSRMVPAWVPDVFGTFVTTHVRAEDRPDARRWQSKAARYAATCDRLQQALAQSEERYRALRERFDVRRHASLDHDILRKIMPIRAARLAPAHDREEAAAREARHLACSVEYARAFDAEGPRAAVERVDIDGLPWWVPAESGDATRIGRAKKQGFPYRAILQTREVAIGGVMLDIGANIGRTSIPRVMLGDVRAVYAAEPEPNNYACLVCNVVEHHVRGVVLPDRVAIGARRGEVVLRRSRYPGGHRVLHGTEASKDTVVVPMWSLDEWIAQLGIDADAVSLVKVDTQGCELAVLQGGPSLLARRHVVWMIEVDPKLLRRAGVDTRELFEKIAAHFSNFIDIGTPAGGPRLRPTGQLAESLAYLDGRQAKTDLLLLNAI
jgi:FkbM family methyltransferase